MATLASAILDRAAVILQDTENVRWTVAELLKWLSDGQASIVQLKPDAGTVNTSVRLKAGARQELPAVGISLVDIPRNMGLDGATPGDAVRMADREDMDANAPGWMTAAPSATVLNFVCNKADPLHFYIYPPQPGTGQGYVEMVYVAYPAAVEAITDAISLPDIYAPMLLDFVLYRAYQKDAEDAVNAQRSTTHMAAFLNMLGVQAKSSITPALVTYPLAPGGGK